MKIMSYLLIFIFTDAVMSAAENTNGKQVKRAPASTNTKEDGTQRNYGAFYKTECFNHSHITRVQHFPKCDRKQIFSTSP
jgi:hypothetical protein